MKLILSYAATIVFLVVANQYYSLFNGGDISWYFALATAPFVLLAYVSTLVYIWRISNEVK